MEFQTLIDHSPTAWHACKNIAKKLSDSGYQQLEETDSWNVKPSGRYYVMRNDSSIIAFITPKTKMQKALCVAAHTDSPGLKLKPCGEFVKEGMTMLHFEVYGAPILPSWIGRDLYLAGRIFFEQNKKVQSMLVELPTAAFMIPNLAFHLDRQINDNGLLVHKQDHLAALVAASGKPFLEPLLKKKIKGTLLHHELYAVPLEKSACLGRDQELIASARMDNLAHAFSSCEAFLTQKPDSQTLKVMALFNYEEIGSMTQEGAASSFFEDVLARLTALQKMSQEELLRFKARSVTLSCDVSHAVHPNFVDRHDAHHLIKLGAGPVIKTNAQCRYVTDGQVAAEIIHTWQTEKIPYQFFSVRNDIPCGSTIGPITAAKLGFKTIDLGIPLLGMHAAREVIHKEDYKLFVKALEVLFSKE